MNAKQFEQWILPFLGQPTELSKLLQALDIPLDEYRRWNINLFSPEQLTRDVQYILAFEDRSERLSEFIVRYVDINPPYIKGDILQKLVVPTRSEILVGASLYINTTTTKYDVSHCTLERVCDLVVNDDGSIFLMDQWIGFPICRQIHYNYHCCSRANLRVYLYFRPSTMFHRASKIHMVYLHSFSVPSNVLNLFHSQQQQDTFRGTPAVSVKMTKEFVCINIKKIDTP